MDVPSTPLNTTPSVAKPRNRLTSAGRAILDGKIMNTLKKGEEIYDSTDYWSRQPSSNLPPLSDRKELTKRVKAS